MRLIRFILLFLVCYNCKNVNQNKSNKIELNKSNTTKSNRLEFPPEPDKTERIKYFQNLHLNSFLENPIDLQEFKRLKQLNYTTTSVSSKKEYYFQPKIKDSIYYTYNYIAKNDTNVKKNNQIVVFKSGKHKHIYNDSSEILIELKIFNNDTNLGKANLVGITKTVLESKFGNSYQNFNEVIYYSKENKVLMLNFKNSKVKSYNYIRLNTEKIDSNLIKQLFVVFKEN